MVSGGEAVVIDSTGRRVGSDGDDIVEARVVADTSSVAGANPATSRKYIRDVAKRPNAAPS